MSQLKDCHHKAMDLAARAFNENRYGNEEEALSLFRQALQFELAAIDALEEYIEPTYSVLHRSAAMLALDCKQLRKAEQLAARALANEPPEFVADQLREVLEQVYAHWKKTAAETGAGD